MTFHGANTVPEGLELGEMKVANVSGFDDFEPIYVVAFTR